MARDRSRLVSQRTVVVGGGLAGIAASLQLARAGVTTTLVEARNVLGGRVRSHGNAPGRDNAQHVFLGACSALRNFLQDIGAAESFLQPRARILVADGSGRTAALGERGPFGPLAPLAGLATYGLLTGRERLGIVRALLTLPKAGRWDAEDDRAFSSWLSDKGQSDRQRRYFWDLVVTPTLNAPPEKVSTAAASFVLRTALLSTRDAIRVGWATTALTDWIHGPAERSLRAAGVDLHLGGRVRGIDMDDGSFSIHTQEGPINARNIVIAVPHGRVEALLPDSLRNEDPFRSLRDLPSAAIVGAHLRYDREVRCPAMLAVPDSEAEWIFGTSTIRNEPTKNGEELTCVLSYADAWLGLRNDEIATRMAQAVHAAVPLADPKHLVESVVYREPAATFVPVPGSRRLRPESATPVPGLFLAGAYTQTGGWPSTMESAVRSGMTAARSVLASVSTTPA